MIRNIFEKANSGGYEDSLRGKEWNLWYLTDGIVWVGDERDIGKCSDGGYGEKWAVGSRRRKTWWLRICGWEEKDMYEVRLIYLLWLWWIWGAWSISWHQRSITYGESLWDTFGEYLMANRAASSSLCGPDFCFMLSRIL